MPAQVVLKALGLNKQPNQLDLPPGSLSVASNVVIRRDNVVEQRRGFKLWGESLGSPTDRAKQLFTYKDRILRHYATTLDFQDGVNNDGTVNFTSFAGNYSETEPGLRIKSIESNGNFYFTTSEGIKKISALTGSGLSSSPGFITNAGGIKALGVTARLNVELGDQASFFTQDSAVAYRVLWGTRDANNNLVRGTPSQRAVLYNPENSLTLRDFSRTLGALDDINQSTSLITDGDYVSTLNLLSTATASQLRNNLVSLTSKLDNDILYANDTGAGVPLTIASGNVAAGTATITFSVGTPTNYWIIGSKIMTAGFAVGVGSVNGAQVVTAVTATTVSFLTSAGNGAITVAGSSIHSNEYRTLTQPPSPSTPATHDDQQANEDYLSDIMLRLQSEPNGVIPTALETQFIDPLDVTTTASVILEITVPLDATADTFYQVYRSSLVTATGTTVLSDLVPSDEMQLVFENFPTTAELASRMITVEDITPDAFRGENLYTNEATGEGITQANDLPPFAKDINRFKNSIFYANTRTRHRLIMSLLGVSNMLVDYFNGLNTKTFTSADVNTGTDTITIAAHGYIDNQSVYFTNPTPANLPGGITQGTLYYILSSTANTFKLSTSQGGAALNITSGGTGTHTIKNSLPSITISNGTASQTFTFVKGVKEVSTVTCVADVANSLNGKYFLLYSANDQTPYYVWYKTSGGTETDPALTGKTGLEVFINTGDSATLVAQKTRDVLNINNWDFTATTSTSTITITNTNFGITTDASAGTSGFTIGTTVQGNGENIATNQVLLSDSPSPAIAVDETANSLVRVINGNSTLLVNAFYLSTASSVPGRFILEARSLTSAPFYIIGSNFNVGTSFNPSISPSTNPIISISASNPTTLTFQSAHGLLNGDSILIANSNSTPSIDGLYAITYVSPTTVTIPVNVTVAGNYAQVINAAFGESSENETKINRVYFSKFQQPESVPLVNYFDVGAENKAILRIFPMRDSLFVFKEDGLFRISGESAPFSLTLFDSSCILIASDSLGISNNIIYVWTTQGISQVTEGGVNASLSRPIDVDILKLGSSNYTNFKTATWGIGYDSDNSYKVYTVSETTDIRATIGYRFSNLTNSWTTIDKTVTCGVLNPVDDKLYLGAGDVNYIEQERKQFERYDYTDREFVLDLAQNNYLGANMRFPTVDGVSEGDVLVQDQTLTTYFYNMLLKKLDNDSGITVKDYFSSLEAFAGDSLREKIVDLAAKLDADPNVADSNYSTTIQSISGLAITSSSVANPTIITTAVPHGLVNNRVVLISGHTGSTPSINGTYQITYLSPTTFSIPVSVTQSGTGGVFSTINANFEDIKACYNAIITKINADTGINFSNYVPITVNTIFESVVTDVNIFTRQITLNLTLDYVQGPVTIYKAIESTTVYSPNILGDPVNFKHLTDATIMFDNKAFTSATLSFSTDLLPAFVDIQFNADSNGIFGHQKFGTGFFGGASNAAPMRTYIPRNVQRCRYFVCKFTHRIARESYAIYGIAVNGENTGSARAYR